MEAKEIKSIVSNLEKSSDDVMILKLLNILSDGVKPTEKLLRETKVGVAVNKYRSSTNSEISSIVKKMIRNWRDMVQAEKNKKKGPTSDVKAATSGSSTPSKENKFHSGPRNPKIDGISTDIYDDSTRNASISALYTALAIERGDSSQQILSVAKSIEAEVFKDEYSKVADGYRNKLRTFVMNLRNKKNPELRDRILSGQITPGKFVKMSPNEMAPETLKKEIEKLHKQNLFDAQGATEKRAVTDRFTCGKCKHKKVSYYQMQTRSADEPLTTFCTCENCGNRWKFS
ncbi:transcription elongation factor TFIIS [Yamadazyma tenuis]|uniref:Transcription elongation factor n=1 Tax=Candida tenuis (strain ATCC 10573 / BCRC 21748 / CBS 615 / JCM 9827 / NBRC 10315 / NRRL Y-1498 / VKM Y-70) TaxID=590646 RepID=G3B2L5_CANTC|nr:transcription elongation factor [Yamadazyma tenuis ATCC 10573]EGV64707.1 transcription elongation factor [Yamadazyma tenuis ATCC 10573]WEJ97495.1 transcription elongation factor TFIIS [Yamadazyma tenuis]